MLHLFHKIHFLIRRLCPTEAALTRSKSALAISTMLILVSCGGETPPLPGPPQVTFASPTSSVHTNGMVSIDVRVFNGTPDSLALHLNGLYRYDEPLIEFTPPYRFEWDTSTLEEGQYSIQAVATFGEETVRSEYHDVWIDRTAPEIYEVAPNLESTSISVVKAQTIRLDFLESLKLEAVTEQNVIVTDQMGQALARSIDFSYEESALNIMLREKPSAPGTLTVRLTGLADYTGNVMPETTYSFDLPEYVKVGDSALYREFHNSEGRSFRLKQDGSGRSLVAWKGYDGIYAYRLSDEALWEPHTELLKTNIDAYILDFDVDGQDRPVFAWYETEAENAEHPGIHVRRWNGSDWDILAEGLQGPSPEQFELVSEIGLEIAGSGDLVLVSLRKERATGQRFVQVHHRGASGVGGAG